MKLRNFVARAGALVLLFGLFTRPVAAQEAAANDNPSVKIHEIGRVIQIEGFSVERKAIDAQHPDELSLGAAVFQYDTITTAAGSKVEIQLVDKTKITLDESTTITLTRYAYLPAQGRLSSLFDLAKGQILAQVSSFIKKHQGNSFEIESSNAVAGVRGSQFITRVEDGETHVYSLESPTYLQNKTGEVEKIEPNFMMSVGKDNAFMPKRAFAHGHLRPRFAVKGPIWHPPANFKRLPPRAWKPIAGRKLPHPWVRKWNPRELSPRPTWIPEKGKHPAHPKEKKTERKAGEHRKEPHHRKP